MIQQSVDKIALKLIHMMFRKGMIDTSVYRQILRRYAWKVKDSTGYRRILNKCSLPFYTWSGGDQMNNMQQLYFGNLALDPNRQRRIVYYGRVSTEHEAQLEALEKQMQWYEDQTKYHPKCLRYFLQNGIPHEWR